MVIESPVTPELTRGHWPISPNMWYKASKRNHVHPHAFTRNKAHGRFSLLLGQLIVRGCIHNIPWHCLTIIICPFIHISLRILKLNGLFLVFAIGGNIIRLHPKYVLGCTIHGTISMSNIYISQLTHCCAKQSHRYICDISDSYFSTFRDWHTGYFIFWFYLVRGLSMLAGCENGQKGQS